VVAYVRALLLPNDEVSLRRVINQPPRGIGPKTVERISTHAETLGVSFPRALADAENIGDLSPQVRASIASFNAMLDKNRKKLAGGHTVAQVTRDLAEDAGLRKHLTDDAEAGESGPIRWSNVEHLFGWIDRMEREQGRDRNQVRGALDRLALGTQSAEEEPGKGVTLSTLHGVKGLEFEVVFLIGCVEGQLPHSRTTDPKLTEVHATDVDEERRLFYVGVTRARDRLYLTRFKNRMFRGKTADLVPSRFLEGLPPEHVETYERPEKQELAPDEIAELGRQFLQKRMASAAKSPLKSQGSGS
jgi:DNA helicase-2/ATP-dependent DNA helicase PcrA